MPEPLFEVEHGPTPGAAEGHEREAAKDSVVVRLHVQPAAGKASVVGRYGDALHVRVAAPPVGGRANAAAAELLAEVLDVKPAQVELAGGERSRSKRFRVRDVDVEQVRRQLDEAVAAASAGPPGRQRRRGGS